MSPRLAGHPGLAATALFLWTFHQHGRGGRLAEFGASIAKLPAERVHAAVDLLKALDDGDRAGDRVVASLIRASEAGVRSEPVLDLLNLTLAYAVSRCRRYRGSGYPALVGSWEEFASVPTLSRQQVEADASAICAEGARIDFYTATSATSTGRALLVPHSREEYRVWGVNLDGGEAPAGADPDSRLTLRLMPAGRLIGGPLGAADTILATYDTNAARENMWDLWDYIAGQVFVEFPSPSGTRPIDTIHATPAFGLILLTKYMLQRGLEPSSSAVKSLLVTGSWLGPATRRWLEHAWGAKVTTSYSCSELVGGAVECSLVPGRYHFGANLLAEVLGEAGQPVRDGEQGRIHLSGLYPFQRSAVFLRYHVGDWGRWHAGGSCGCGLLAPSVDMLGRGTDVLTVTSPDGTRRPIPPVPVRNALDSFDCVPKIPRPQHKLRLEASGGRTVLHVDVECYALAGTAWQSRIRDAMAEAILEEDESIRALVGAGEIELHVALHSRSKLTNSLSVI